MNHAAQVGARNALPPVAAGARLGWLSLLVAVGLVQTGTLLGSAWATQQVLEPMLQNGAAPGQAAVWLLVVLAAVGGACRWVERTAAEQLGNQYVHEVRLALYDAITRSRANRRGSHGVHMVRFTGDLTAVRQWVALGIARTFSTGLFLSGVVLALWFLHADSALLATGILLLAVAAIWVLGIGLERSVRRARRERGKLANLVADTLTQAREIVAFGRIERERQRLEQRSGRLNSALQQRARWLGGLTAFTDLVHRALMIALIVVGCRAMLAAEISMATLLTLCSVAALLGGPLRDLGRVYEYRKNFDIASSKLATVLLRVPHRPTHQSLPAGRGHVTLDAVALEVTAATNELNVRPGERIAVVGANGCGKSTLLSLLAGLDVPARGRVLLDGVPTDRLSPTERSAAIGFAAHRGGLASGSVGKNIRYRRPGAGRRTVRRAVRAAGLERWLGRQPQGLRTRLSDRHGGVSEGEASRIKLARALLANPRLLLLDEIEAGLDAAGRRALERVLKTFPGTVVFATHDAALAAKADQTWRLHDGAIHTSPRQRGATAEVITL